MILIEPFYRQQQQNNFPTSSTVCSVSLTPRARASCWAARNVLILSLDVPSLFFQIPPGWSSCRQMAIKIPVSVALMEQF